MRRTRQSVKSSIQTQCQEGLSPNGMDDDSANGTGRPRPKPTQLKSPPKRIKLLKGRPTSDSQVEHLDPEVGLSATISSDGTSIDAINSNTPQNSGSRSRSRFTKAVDKIRPVHGSSPSPTRPTVSEADSSNDEEYEASSVSSSDSDSSFYESTKPSKQRLSQTNQTRPRNKKNDGGLVLEGLDVRGKRPSRLLLNVRARPTSKHDSNIRTPTLASKPNKKVSKLSGEDSSSDSSSDEFLRVRPSDVLPDDLTSQYFQVKKEDLPAGNDSSLSNNVLPGVASTTLSGSDSEVEYTQMNWPSIPGSSQCEAVATTARAADASPVRKKPTRSGARAKGGNKIKEESKDNVKTLNVLQLLMLGEGLSSEARGIGNYQPSDDDVTDLEEVSMDEEMVLEDNHPKQPAIPKEGVQITLEVPEIAQKKKKKGFDMQAYLLRRLNDRRRSIQVLIHKVHILAWIAHGRFVNTVLNSDILMGLSLSIIPSRHCYPPKRADLNYLEQFVAWFLKNIPLKSDVIATYPPDLLTSLQGQFNSRSASSKRDLVLMFICFLRSLGIKARLVMSLQPAPLKLGSSGLCTALPTKAATNKSKSPVKQEQKDTSAVHAKNVNQSKSKKAKSSTGKRRPTVKKSEYFSAGKKSKDNAESKSKYFPTGPNTDMSIDTAESNEPSTSALPTKTARETKSKYENKSKYFNKAENTTEKKSPLKCQKPEPNSNKPTCANKVRTKSPENKSMPTVSGDKKINIAGRKMLPTRQSKSKVTVVSEFTSDESDFEPELKRPKRNRTSSLVDAGGKSKSKKLSSKRNSSKSKSKPSIKARTKPEDSNSDSDFEPEKERKLLTSCDSAADSSVKSDREELVIVKKPPKKWSGKLDRRVLSSESDVDEATKTKKKHRSKDVTRMDKKLGIDVWCEVFLEAEEKWFCVDVPKKKVHCYADLHAKATQPVLYVVGFNPDLSLKDVTRRYVVNWSTIKQRVDETWWEKTLRRFVGNQTPQDREEEEELSNNMQNHPLPTAIGEYKNHPLYALKRHLLKFEAIYPPDAPTLGFVRGEAVYSRDCVAGLHSREVWVKEAKVVKPGEEPYKVVKARPKYDKLSGNMITDLPLEVFGKWQVGDYVPPTAENGKVPRNEYGNVELFKPCMLPKGTVHLPIPGLSRVARKLGIDCAPAMIGFDYHSGGSHPTYDGYVVCEEHKEIILDAWRQETEESEKRAAEKLEKRVYDNWKRLIKGLLIRERLRERYSFGLPQPSTSKDKPTRGKNTRRKR